MGSGHRNDGRTKGVGTCPERMVPELRPGRGVDSTGEELAQTDVVTSGPNPDANLDRTGPSLTGSEVKEKKWS